jgi:hypothetical protein
MELEQWTSALAGELGIDLGEGVMDIRALLDLARVAAHNVDRPAAPLTTFLVGYAAALGGGTREAADNAMATASALAGRWVASR